MNALRIVIATMCAVAISAACATTSSSSGSNSNWLEVCSKDSDCGSGLECQCGVCTKTCTAASDCSALATGATCDPGDTTSICGTPQTRAVCLHTCKADGDCNVIGQNTSCSDGLCKRARAIDGGLLSCNDRGNAVQARYHAILTAADTASNKACTVDTDCVPAPAVPCSDHCGLPFLSKTGAASIATELANLDRDLCTAFFAAGCPEFTFFCPAIGFPKCVAGACENSFGPLSDGGHPTCEERTRQMSDVIQAATDRADKACATDDNCKTVSLDIACYHACESSPVSEAGAAEVTTALGTVESMCIDFDAAGCKSFVPPCTPPLPLKCVAGRCANAQ